MGDKEETDERLKCLYTVRGRVWCGRVWCVGGKEGRQMRVKRLHGEGMGGYGMWEARRGGG